MSIALGGGGDIPVGNTTSIRIPDSGAPESQLKQDSSIALPLLTNVNGMLESFKVQASIGDILPGYLDAKINLTQFAISGQLLNLIGFDGLTSDNLNEGVTNLYLNEANFDTILALKTTDNLTEGIENFYYSTDRFNTDFASKSTTNLNEGINLYFTDARAEAALSSHTSNSSIHLSNLSSFNTDNLSEGAANKYMTAILAQEITDNTSNRHNHTNKSLLDAYTQSNSSISSAISLAHDHSNKVILDATEESFTTVLKAKYDGYEAGSISSVAAPLLLNSGILSHSSADGDKHVPSNASASQYNVLASGASVGSYLWTNIETIVGASGVLEAIPSTSTTKGVQSAWINNHNSNVLVDVNHITDAEATYLDTTIPNHISSTILHVPSFTSSDNGKFLYIDSGTSLTWTDSAVNITISGESYLSASGSVITASKIDLSETNIAAGANVSISGNQISAIQRSISSSATSAESTVAISSGWAYSHKETIGTGGHIPTGGTIDQYVSGDGTIQDFSSMPGQVYKIVMGYGADGTVAERLTDAATIFPTDWSGVVGAVATDLDVTHTVLKKVVDVTIHSDDGTNITKLIGSAAYATIIGNQTLDLISIVSLTTINNVINIYIQFE